MPIEPPVPTGRILDTLRTALGDLQALAGRNPADMRLAPAITSLAEAIKALELPAPSTLTK